jgi:hypothetical protein
MPTKSANIKIQSIDTSKIDTNLQVPFQELTLALIRKYGSHIVSIVLFGSSTTGDWIRGKSDVDFIVVTDGKANKSEIENFVNQTLIMIDGKYNLMLKQTCSTFRKSRNIAINAISTIESFMTFGKPFFILSKDQIETKKGKIKDLRIMFVTSIFDSISIFAAKIKETGVTIYGDNLIKELNAPRSGVEKTKAFLAPFWLVMMSFAIFPVNTKLAFGHSIKATLWACEDSLFYLDQTLSSTTNELNLLRKIFGDSKKFDIKHLELAIRSKPYLKAEKIIEKENVLQFLFYTPIFILTLFRATRSLRRYNV